MAKKTRKKQRKLKTFLVPKLRSASLYWDRRQEVFDRIKVERGKYACEQCGVIGPRKDIDIDHIEPVIPLDGSMDWNNPEHVGTFVLKLFCEACGLQGICKPCHSIKTMTENEMRKHYSAKRKEEIKKKLNAEAAARKKNGLDNGKDSKK